MLKVTWNMSNGKTYESFMGGKTWTDVATFICDNDFIVVHENGKEILLQSSNICDFSVEAA